MSLPSNEASTRVGVDTSSMGGIVKFTDGGANNGAGSGDGAGAGDGDGDGAGAGDGDGAGDGEKLDEEHVGDDIAGLGSGKR